LHIVQAGSEVTPRSVGGPAGAHWNWGNEQRLVAEQRLPEQSSPMNPSMHPHVCCGAHTPLAGQEYAAKPPVAGHITVRFAAPHVVGEASAPESVVGVVSVPTSVDAASPPESVPL
jgi:hypothetical protein